MPRAHGGQKVAHSAGQGAGCGSLSFQQRPALTSQQLQTVFTLHSDTHSHRLAYRYVNESAVHAIHLPGDQTVMMLHAGKNDARGAAKLGAYAELRD